MIRHCARRGGLGQLREVEEEEFELDFVRIDEVEYRPDVLDFTDGRVWDIASVKPARPRL